MFSNTLGKSFALPLHNEVNIFSILPIKVLPCRLMTARISPLLWSWSTTQSLVSLSKIGQLFG